MNRFKFYSYANIRNLLYKSLGVFLILSIQIFEIKANASSRVTNRLGVDLGLFTNPFPSTYGYTANFNLNNYLRFGVGYAVMELLSPSTFTGKVDVKTISIETKIFPLDWNMSPFFDLGITNISGPSGASGQAGAIQIKSIGTSVFYGLGIDWQAMNGFNFGVEYKMLTIKGSSINIPGTYIGWYFF